VQGLRDELCAFPTRVTVDDAKHLDPCLHLDPGRRLTGVQLGSTQDIMSGPVLDRVVAFDIVGIKPDDRSGFGLGIGGKCMRDGVPSEFGFSSFWGEALVFMLDDATTGFDAGGTASRPKGKSRLCISKTGPWLTRFC